MKSNYKYLTKNIMLFTISGLGTKIITFFLVPLYTNFLTTREYGTIDLLGTITNITIPLFTFCLEASVLRFCFDKKYVHSDIFATSIYIWLRGILFNLLLVGIFYLTDLFKQYDHFLVFYLVIFICSSIKDILTSFYRGTNRVEIMVETSLINAVTLCGFNIIFLTILDMKINGYILAVFSSSLIVIIWGLLRLKVKCYYKLKINRELLKELQVYGKPLIFNQIGWWLNNSVDKYIVIYFLNMAENGIYSVAYKIPTILSVFSGVFSNAWSLSAIKEIDSEDANEFSTKMYILYNTMQVLSCSFLIIFNIPLAKLLFANDFFEAWKISGILILATVFNGLSGFLGCFFAAVKDTKSFATSTIAGGVINILTSLLMVNFWGIKGVAYGTLISYIFIWIIRLKKSKRYIHLAIPIQKHCIMYTLLLIECIIGLHGIKFYVIFAQVLLFIILFLINYRELRILFTRIFILIKSKFYGGKI